MKTQISNLPRLQLLFIALCAAAFTNCGRVNYKYYGVVYSKNKYPVPNAKLYFEFMIGSKETNTDLRSTTTDGNGYYEITFSEPRRSSLHGFTIESDSSSFGNTDYRTQQPANNRKSDIYLK